LPNQYRLYGRVSTGSAAVEAALEIAGVPTELVEVPEDAAAARASGYHSINPRGQVPALTLPDSTTITECAATLLHIADAFPAAKLAPIPGSFARAHHDRWLLFCHANLYEAELRHYYPDRYTRDTSGIDGVQQAAEAYVKQHYQMLEAGLPFGEFCLGNTLTVLDIYLWMLVQWTDQDWLLATCPKLTRVTDKIAQLPTIAPTHRKHFP
jgi:glutathione S-transferase